MHRTDDRSPLRFILVQFPAFLAGFCLCVIGSLSVQVSSPDMLAKAGILYCGLKGIDSLCILGGLGIFSLMLGLELWRNDRPRE